MLGDNGRQLKLIDFGFAVAYENDQTTIELPVQGTITLAGQRFLTHYMKSHSDSYPNANAVLYNYERTFDLQCAINIIVVMAKSDIKTKITSIQALPSYDDKVKKLLQLWETMKNNDKSYCELLESIDDSKETFNFNTIKEKIKLFLNNINNENENDFCIESRYLCYL